jgi:hypothetical protein
MTASVLEAAAPPVVAEIPRLDQLEIEREQPDTDRAAEFDGCPMVQSFLVSVDGAVVGRCWITTADALAVPAFGRGWIAARLNEQADAIEALRAPGGLRLS